MKNEKNEKGKEPLHKKSSCGVVRIVLFIKINK
jgi:hypothetical protein